MNIGRLAVDDLPAVAQLEAKVQRDPWSAAQILAVADLLHDNYWAWGARDEAGQVCAYLIAQHVVDAFEVLTIGVDSAQQGRGIARALWQFAWADMRTAQPDTHTCFLEVRVSNLAARVLYDRCGFIMVGQRRNYYQNPSEDALILQFNDHTIS